MTAPIIPLDESDDVLLQQADELFQEEQLLAAARLIRQVKDVSKFKDVHLRILANAQICEHAVRDLLSEPSKDHGWFKQGENHGTYETTIYYKVESGARLTCRNESPIPASLLVPLLSVLNESNLYHTWIPSWKTPIKLGVRNSQQLVHDTRGHQIIQIQCDVPWPITPREVLMDVIAIDDIEERGFIIAKMRTLDSTMTLPEGFEIPPVQANMERIDFDGAVLFRPCPTDHPNYAAARQKTTEDLILLQFTMFFDAHLSMVPTSMINFVTRTVIGYIWNMLLHVAEQVRDGKRKEHGAAIAEKADFYRWLKERTEFMMQDVQQKSQQKPVGQSEKKEDETWTMKDALNIAL